VRCSGVCQFHQEILNKQLTMKTKPSTFNKIFNKELQNSKK